MFDPKLLEADAVTMGFSVDGVDFGLWEIQHEEFPQDRQACSHKIKRCAAKYLIVLSTSEAKCLQIVGPEKGGVTDNTMMKNSGILEKLVEAGKVCSGDLGFRMKEIEFQKVMSLPDYMDEKELHQFKTRMRLRQETFNSRLKFFRTLSETFEYGFTKHELVLHAVAVTVQYQMDLGSPIFDV